ncbi:MAG: extracellular solute-binding protein [Clostridia bacterium]|nr:extracellular solute-binding protein [Clostridia bacterium]
MKKLLALFLAALILTLTLVGCQNSFYPTYTTIQHTHTYEDWKIAKNPTCTESGEEVRYCSCGEKQTQTVASVGHTPGEWIVDLEPTVEAQGSMHIECTVCNETLETQTIDKLTPPPYGLVLTLNGDGTAYFVTGISNSTIGDVVIPSEYNGLPVIAIGSYAFSGSKSITSVTIPTSVTELGKYIFYNCSVTNVSYEGTVDEWYEISGNNNVFKKVETVTCKDGEAVDLSITLWVSTTYGVKEFTQQLIEAFLNEHPAYSKYTIVIETVGEGDAATEVLKDVANAPDMYCFSQDQISRLVQSGALAPLGQAAAAEVTKNNDSGSVNAATVNGSLYAYPMTSDNGYFLYYDASVISDEQAKTLEGIIEACKMANKRFGYNLTNGWFTAGFFFSQPVGGGAPLCTSTWTYTESNTYPIAVNDTFNSANGLIAMNAMHKLATSGAWIDTADNFSGTAAIVTGIWNASQAEAVYGENMKATKLPTFVGSDGNTYQMGSFSGNKLIGCKPQTDEIKSKLCTELAMYLTSADAQLDRYYEFLWGPSNLEAQANQDVQDNVILTALLQQNAYAQPQGTIPGHWWTEAAVLGMNASQSNATDEDLNAALEEYEAKINSLVEE